ncbi:hypothetical protein [Streptomyces alkaliterrae]|uniref:Secreted protein n=1 Tax=Streptomyces alkaliterrae TaxID=2213162 RepID=A0A5P0YTF2_9ACTN|nr:hypothetical protein [Streptomyces alkaliterrae]MBB1255202.1 hypothetical protein [Streptomyces alkaliterrae]MBB1261547.1 hypothetical protein [Streptomyces alkaliterrae]MQS03594.1 hypothetical protein [Streptomyces alkaliterrae]
MQHEATASTGPRFRKVATAVAATIALTSMATPSVAADFTSDQSASPSLASQQATEKYQPALSTADIVVICKNNGRHHVVRTYFRGIHRYTLRCGTDTWGWKHIKHRWSRSFDNKISNAIADGRQVLNTFSIWTLPPCSRETFRVLVSTPAASNDVRTAYKVNSAAGTLC